MTENLVQKYKLQEYIQDYDLQDFVKENLNRKRDSLRKLKEEKVDLFPFEENLSGELEKTLEKEIYRLDLENKYGVNFIDLSFLSQTKNFSIPLELRNSKLEVILNLPLFATYYKDNNFDIEVENKDGRYIKHKYLADLPFEISEKLRISYLCKKNGVPNFTYNSSEEILSLYNSPFGDSSKKMRISVKSEFFGKLPNEVKEKINSVKEDFHDLTFLIAEANYSKAETKKDPLVVKFDKKHNEPYLIACFDCTPLENYVAGDFSLNKSGQN